MIRFAIVTPSFNQGRFLERTIRSVLTQSYPGLEYVICDSASSDETPSVLARYAHQARLIIEPDSGQAQAVNKGMRATSGDIIGWVNSDDTYCSGALVTIAAFFTRHTDIDVVYGDANLVDVDDRVVGRYYTQPWNKDRLLSRPFLCQPAVFFRRSILDRFGYLDEELHFTLDYEYWLRLAHGGARFAYFPHTVANARVHAATKTATHGVQLYEELAPVLRRYASRVPDRWILTYAHAVLRQQRTRPFSEPLDFARAIVRESLTLSMRLNGSVSVELLVSSARTLCAGAVKSALRMPLRLPTV